MEVNWDRAIGEVAGDPRRNIDPGESLREIAFLRFDIFGGKLSTTPTTAVFARTSKGDGNEREEGSESDRETKNHVRRKRQMKMIKTGVVS